MKFNGRASGDHFRRRVFMVLILLLSAGTLALQFGSRLKVSQLSEPSSVSDPDFLDQTAPLASAAPKQPIGAVLGRLPLSFEPNLGQTDPQVKFLARGSGYGLFLTGDGAVLQLLGRRSQYGGQDTRTTAAVSMKLAGANPTSRINGSDQLAGKSNYLIGNNPSKWHGNVPHFARVRYQDVYPGVDLVYYGTQGQLEYDFEVAPGADPKLVQLSFAGQDKLVLDRQGDLVVRTGAGEARLHAPVVYQWANGSRKAISGRFVLETANRVGFAIGNYDRSRTLVIDPTLSYSSYLGGSGNETSPSIAVDSSFDIYVAGQTTSLNFPIPTGTTPFHPCLNTAAPPPCPTGNTASDVFVAKLDPTGSSLIFATYLGGSGTDSSVGIGVDSATNVYVAGNTGSTDFPTLNGFQDTCTGCTGNHVFVTELKPDGSGLVYSTYLAGNGIDTATGFFLDSKAYAYVTGFTTSTNSQPGFPATANAFQLSSLATTQFFASKIIPTSSGTASLAYSTYFGGGNPASGQATGGGIAVDSVGNVYFTGGTNFLHVGGANDFPIVNAAQACLDVPAVQTPPTPPPPCPTTATLRDAFVAKINPNVTGAAGLVYSTYLGGNGDDVGTGIAVDAGDNVYVTGSTASEDQFIPTPVTNALQRCLDTPTNPPPGTNCPTGLTATDAFLAKLSNPATGSAVAITYFSYLGGSSDDSGAAVAVDNTQIARVIGTTASGDFPSKNAGSFTTGPLGGTDAFVARFDTTGAALGSNFSSRLGGSGTDHGTGIALDANFIAYVTGDTGSNNFPIAGSAFQGTAQGGTDAFVAKIGSVSDLAVTAKSSILPVGTPTGVGNPVTFTFTITNNGPDPTSGVSFTANVPASGVTFTSITSSPGNCGSPTNGAALCSIGTLLSGGTATVTEVLVPTVGSTQLTASGTVSVPSVNPPSIDPNPGNNSASTSVGVTDFAITEFGSPQTVPAGTSAFYNIQVGPAGNLAFTNNISVACSSGLPQGASCAFSTNPLTMTGTSPASSTLTISTTPRPVTTTRLHSIPSLLYAVLLPMGGLVFFGLGKTSRKRWPMMSLLLGLALTSVLLQVACGGGGSSASPVNPGTPAGTYSITVTGTSGSASHATAVTLVVQ